MGLSYMGLNFFKEIAKMSLELLGLLLELLLLVLLLLLLVLLLLLPLLLLIHLHRPHLFDRHSLPS